MRGSCFRCGLPGGEGRSARGRGEATGIVSFDGDSLEKQGAGKVSDGPAAGVEETVVAFSGYGEGETKIEKK